jgi:hypothetical protein
VIVPIYRELQPAEYAIVKHNLTVLENWPVTLISSIKSKALVEELRRKLNRQTQAIITVELFADQYFDDVSGYNDLMLSRTFYNRFSKCKNILICQHDALIISNSLAEWIDRKFAFIGAPHFEGFHDPILPYKFRGSQNGGLSLRNISMARSIILVRPSQFMAFLVRQRILPIINFVLGLARRVIVEYEPGLNEDIVWSEVVPSVYKKYILPPPEVAARFAFETSPSYLFSVTGGRLPFGCHAYERYEPEFWRSHLPVELVPLLNSAVGQTG